MPRPAGYHRSVRPGCDPSAPGGRTGIGSMGPPARARALPRTRRASAADPPAVPTAGLSEPSPAVAVDLLLERTPSVLRPRSRRLFVLGPEPQPDDPDRSEMGRHAESIQELAFPVGDAEEPSAEPFVHRGEQHQ